MVPTKQEILTMKDLTRMTGLINQVQSHQLKMYCLVILCANQAEIEFDPELYQVVADISKIDSKALLEGYIDKSLKEAFTHRALLFNDSVKFLLGDEYQVIIKMANNLLADFPPTTPPQKAHTPRE